MASILERTIGEAAKQARRLEDLIIEYGGLWSSGQTWIDLSHVREVHTIVACLEDFGPLAIGVDSLIRAGLISGSVPWIVSIHDLEVASRLLSPPAQFLVYLRRRTEPEVIKKVMATDELDILMWFIRGEFYYEPDPEELRKKYTYMVPATKAEKARFRKQIPTRVGTFTDPLDAWMYFEEGQVSTPADRPNRRENARVVEILESLRNSDSPGWLSIGADLLNLSGVSQKNLARSVGALVRMCRSDGQFHSLTLVYPSLWGMTLVIFGTQPATGQDFSSRLLAYTSLKKHQTQADRAICIMLAENGRFLNSAYDNSPHIEDPEVDDLVARMGLVSSHQGFANRREVHKSPKPKRKRRR